MASSFHCMLAMNIRSLSRDLAACFRFSRLAARHTLKMSIAVNLRKVAIRTGVRRDDFALPIVLSLVLNGRAKCSVKFE